MPITPSIPVDEEIHHLLSEVYTTLDSLIEQCWNKEEAPEQANMLVEGAQTLSHAFIRIGDFSYDKIQSRQNIHTVGHFILAFQWSGQAKAFLILWRDVLFQQQKGNILFEGERAGKPALEKLRRESARSLKAAAEDLKAFYKEQFDRAMRGRKTAQKMVAQWQLQANPWPVYKEQMMEIPRQCRFLLENADLLLEVQSGFKEIRLLIAQTIQGCENKITHVEKTADATINIIEEESAKEQERSLGKIAARIEDIEAEIQTDNHFNLFATHYEKSLDGLPGKTGIALNTREGIVELMDINFKKRCRLWLESEVLPLLYEIWELTDNADNGLKMSLINIRNRALLLSAESQEGKVPDFEKADISQPLSAFLKNLEASKSELEVLSGLTNHRLDTHFRLHLLYLPEQEFLPVPLQSTINQFRLNRSKLLTNARMWLRAQWYKIKSIQRSVEQEESLSPYEKVVRFIKERSGDPDNSHYTSIFITKGYIGESFWVGRENELEHIRNSIENWRKGFRGAVAITGKRLSGKSLLGDLVAARNFPDKTIRLSPGLSVNVQGRKFKAGFDLKEALDFIRKYTLNSRSLIWIDDLELWWEPAIPLSKNIRALRKFIDNHANNLFIMVSMSNWLRTHFNKFHELDKTFQTEISLDNMALSEVRNALLIRHGATHTKLVDEKVEELKPRQFERITQKIYNEADGIIGEALNIWSYSTYKIDEDHVSNRFENRYALPDFLSPDAALLLSSIMIQKKTNEYRLRKLFGPPFADKYIGILQRLISIGILKRHLDGWLEVNELVLNELGKLLERRNYIKYH